MGGSVERIEVLFIADPRKDPAQAQAELTATFENFDAAKAECFLPKDRERLLAVIEAGFGDVREFNKIVRRIFAGRHMVVSMGDERCEGGQGVLSKACRDEVRRAIEANLLLEGFAQK